VKLAITGANGLLGGDAVAQADARHEVLAISRGPCRLPAGRYTYVDADLGDGASVERAIVDFGAQAVLHAGAMTDVDACERDPETAYRVNVGGSEQVARACRKVSARLVAISTDYVFDGEAGPYGEEAVPNPRGFYARSKRAGEEAALMLAPDCAVARVAVVFSGRKGAKKTFATQIVEALTKGDVVKAFADQTVSPTLAANAAEMTLELLLENDFRGVLHTSGSDSVDRVTFAQRLAQRFGLEASRIVPVKLADVKLAAPRPKNSGLKTERAFSLLNAKPLSLDQAFERFQSEWAQRES
jgi:dTDP-4-dehydrorhamnose reductase